MVSTFTTQQLLDSLEMTSLQVIESSQRELDLEKFMEEAKTHSLDKLVSRHSKLRKLSLLSIDHSLECNVGLEV